MMNTRRCHSTSCGSSSA